MDITEFSTYLKNKIIDEGYNFFKYGAFHQFEPMKFYLKNKCNNFIDIIKMDDETYQNKINEICNKYNFTPNSNHINVGHNHKKYNIFYKNKILMENINFIYDDDFKLFGYKKISV